MGKRLGKRDRRFETLAGGQLRKKENLPIRSNQSLCPGFVYYKSTRK